MDEIEEKYGTKIAYDPGWSGPLNLKRRTTDKKCLVSMVIYVAAWTFLAYYVFSHEPENKFSQKNDFNQSSRFARSVSTNTTDLPSKKIDFINHVYEVLIFALVSGLLTFLYIVMVCWLAKVFVYGVIYFIILVLVCISLYFGYEYHQDKPTGPMALTMSFSILGLFALVVFFLRRRIDIACEIVKEGCKALLCIPSTLFFPVFSGLLVCPLLIFTTVVSIKIILVKISQESTLVSAVLHSINILGALWLYSFIFSTKRMILSMAFSAWYWAPDKSYLPTWILLKSTKITLRYHLGTVAIGSFIVAICEAIVDTLKSIKRKFLKSCCCCYYINPIAWIVNFCFDNCVNSFIRAISYINKNAYIMCATHGTDFYTSAADAFNLLMRNLLRVYSISKVSSLIICIGKIFIILMSVLLNFGYNQWADKDDNVFVYVAIIISSYVLSKCVFHVLQVAIDTIFLSVLEDSERNDGSELRPYFMNNRLRELILKKEEVSES